jgi:hypothetical protein
MNIFGLLFAEPLVVRHFQVYSASRGPTTL